MRREDPNPINSHLIIEAPAAAEISPAHGGLRVRSTAKVQEEHGSCSKSGNTDALIGTNEDVLLDKRKRMDRQWARNVHTILRFP